MLRLLVVIQKLCLSPVGHLCCHDNNPFTAAIVYLLSNDRATVYENGYLRTGVTNIGLTVKH